MQKELAYRRVMLKLSGEALMGADSYGINRSVSLQLSGGEQQRVAIARAFINRPQILFADEPTGNLDRETGDKIINLLFELNTVAGTTLILVTHDMELTQHVTRIIQLKGGVIISDSPNNDEAAKPISK